MTVRTYMHCRHVVPCAATAIVCRLSAHMTVHSDWTVQSTIKRNRCFKQISKLLARSEKQKVAEGETAGVKENNDL